MDIERRTEREFAIYNVTNDKFQNLDYLNELDSEIKFVDEPAKTFTYEECERYLVHFVDKEHLTIVNLFQPKYLLAFYLDHLRKEYAEKYYKELKKLNKNDDFERINNKKINVEKNKQTFFQDMHSWDKKLNSIDTQINGKTGQVLKEKPTLLAYGLELDDLTSFEQDKLK